jgi:hypothetical protein
MGGNTVFSTISIGLFIAKFDRDYSEKVYSKTISHSDGSLGCSLIFTTALFNEALCSLKLAKTARYSTEYTSSSYTLQIVFGDRTVVVQSTFKRSYLI